MQKLLQSAFEETLVVSSVIDTLNERYGPHNMFNYLLHMYASDDYTELYCPTSLINKALKDQTSPLPVLKEKDEYTLVCKIPNAGFGLQMLRTAIQFPKSVNRRIFETGFEQAVNLAQTRMPAQQINEQWLVFQVMIIRSTAYATIQKAVGEFNKLQVTVMPRKDDPITKWNGFWKQSTAVPGINSGQEVYAGAMLACDDPVLILYQHYMILGVHLNELDLIVGYDWDKQNKQEIRNNNKLSLQLEAHLSTTKGIDASINLNELDGLKLISWIGNNIGTCIKRFIYHDDDTKLESWYRKNINVDRSNVDVFLETCPRKFLLINFPEKDKAQIVAVCQRVDGNHEVYMIGAKYSTKDSTEITNIWQLITDKGLSKYRVSRTSVDVLEFNQGVNNLDTIASRASYAEASGLAKSFDQSVASYIPLRGGCWKPSLVNRNEESEGDRFTLAALEPLIIGTVLRKGPASVIVVAETPQYCYPTEDSTTRADFFRTYHVLSTRFREDKIVAYSIPCQEWNLIGDGDMAYFRAKHITG